ncbi:S8 family serine peptidase [Marilutibacter alkalisoli]|uniref:S8 family serine peptidase n=1 Tax=Marilutibacter alkalisoli TaxID=2591633 RepID=A0A514BSK4_9GAMM|nr:S8 family serine peptidase [Lysobacter alkalisoli]QDH70373.1 S8 family serine peptidase [Lysobacter alkalisoli]
MKNLEITNARGLRRGALALAITLSLAACGGGGSSNVRPVDPPPTAPPPPVVLDPNPAYSQHIALTGADQAHAAGLTGAGYRIGIVDSGVNRDHPALSPRVVSNLVYISSNGNDLSVDDKVGHGTAVAQAAAGTAFGAWPGGIAPGAEIVSARIISDEPPEDDGSGGGNEVDGPLGLAPIHQDLINRGVRIMNNSWGGLYWNNPNATDAIAQEYRPFILSNDGLVVFATGNSGFADPSDMAALPSQPGPNGSLPAADLERGWIAVAALDKDDPTQLASYSNACGIAMNYCMVAPGTVVVTGTDDAPNDPSYWSWSGTSLAAPLVSGAAALVWEAFPYFNNDLVRQTLLGTATDLGDPGVDDVFGHGMLNVAKAIRGPGRLDWGNVTATFSGTSTWSNDITGAGGIIKRGSGTLRLTGRNAYQGTTQVRNGTLRSSFSVPGAATVSSGGNLELVRGVNGNLTNNGTVTTLSTRTHQVSGNYTQSSSARFAFEVGAPLRVTGTATLNGGEAHVLGVADGYTTSQRENILIAQGGLSGQFDELTWADGVFLEATLSYDPTTAWLNIARLDVSATAMGLAGVTAASASAAVRMEQAFQGLDEAGNPDNGGNVVIDGNFRAMAGAFQRTPTEAAALSTLESLSGELHTADTALAMMAIDGGRHALESRLDSAHGQVGGGIWADAVSGKRAMSRLDVDASGWVLGQDHRFGAFTVGAAFSELDGVAWSSARGDRERNRQVEGQLYAQWQHNDAYVFGRYTSGRMDRRMQRQVLLGGQAFGVDSDYASRYDTLGLQAGYRFDADGSVITPYLGLQSLRMRRDGFDEPGAAGFGLSAEDSTLRASQALAGLRFGREWHSGATRFDLTGRIEWQRTLSQSGTDIDARFTGIDVWSPIAGRGLDRDVGVFGFGLGSELPGWGRFSLNLDTRREFGETLNTAWVGWNKAF